MQDKGKRYSQRTLFDREAFDSSEHCKLCKAWIDVKLGLKDKSALPHVGHHSKCPRKRSKSKAQEVMERIMKQNIAHNNTPIVKMPGSRKEGADIRTILGTTATPTTKDKTTTTDPDSPTTYTGDSTAVTITPKASAKSMPTPNNITSTIELMKEHLHLGTMLRRVLETEM